MINGLKGLVVFGVAVMTAATVRAADITVGWTADNVGIALEDGTAVPQGDLIQIGRFTTAPTVGSPDLSNFVVFDSSTMGAGFNVDGFFDVSSTEDEAGFANQQIYLVVFNAPLAVNATQLGIYTWSTSNWFYPESTDIPNSTAVNTVEITSSAGVIFGNTTEGVPDGNSFLRLAVIPEPSTAVMVGLGSLLGAFLRRRRG